MSMRTWCYKPRLLRLNSLGTQNMILRTALVLDLGSVVFPLETRTFRSPPCGIRWPKYQGPRCRQETTTTRIYCCLAVWPSWRHDRCFESKYDLTIWSMSIGTMTPQREFAARHTPTPRAFSSREPKIHTHDTRTCETHDTRTRETHVK